MKENKRKRDTRGITLIALVVTIIILIILATISVNMVFSENGIISKAKESKQHQLNAVASDEKDMNRLEGEYVNIIAEDDSGRELEDITPDTPAGTAVKKPETTTPENKWSEKVIAISDGSGNAIPLPNGFYYVGGSRTEGLVISDNAADKNKGTSYEIASTLVGNQYVWIPVDNETALTRTTFDTSGKPTTSLSTNYQEPYESGYSDGKGTQEIEDFNTMKTQVLKYKGFYIGRYEAGDADAGSTTRAKVTIPHAVVVKKGIAPYNYIPWGQSMSDVDTKIASSSIGNNPDNVETYGAVYLSKHMYDGKEQAGSIVSTLCYGSQWDAMCRYIGDAQRNTPAKTSLELTGSKKEDVSKNIYDLVGNCREWTIEALNSSYFTNRISRGGNYGGESSISTRTNEYTSQCHDLIAFRPAIYVKD